MNRLYEQLANLLEYPNDDWNAQLQSFKNQLAEQRPDLSTAFAIFREKIADLSLDELRERYTQTFDLTPVCTLEIGYHLFGENYKRGELLAYLNQTEEECGVSAGNQLPDYLPVMLRLLAKLDDEELYNDLILQCMLPALDKMETTLSQKQNPYRDLIAIVGRVLMADVPAVDLAIARADWRDRNLTMIDGFAKARPGLPMSPRLGALR
jgi:nitrate reductase molybdenum cofactor assembly chaperone